MSDAVKLEVTGLGGAVIEHQDGAVTRGKVVLEGQDLAPIAQRVLGQQAKFREAVEHDSGWLQVVDTGDDVPDRLTEFDLGRVQDRLLAIRIEAHLIDEFVDLDAVEQPSVRGRCGAELIRGLGERHIETALAVGGAVEKKLKGKGGLASARSPLQEVEPLRCETATQDLVQAWYAGRDPRAA